jgi:hypothetical protein
MCSLIGGERNIVRNGTTTWLPFAWRGLVVSGAKAQETVGRTSGIGRVGEQPSTRNPQPATGPVGEEIRNLQSVIRNYTRQRAIRNSVRP